MLVAVLCLFVHLTKLKRLCSWRKKTEQIVRVTVGIKCSVVLLTTLPKHAHTTKIPPWRTNTLGLVGGLPYVFRKLDLIIRQYFTEEFMTPIVDNVPWWQSGNTNTNIASLGEIDAAVETLWKLLSITGESEVGWFLSSPVYLTGKQTSAYLYFNPVFWQLPQIISPQKIIHCNYALSNKTRHEVITYFYQWIYDFSFVNWKK